MNIIDVKLVAVVISATVLLIAAIYLGYRTWKAMQKVDSNIEIISRTYKQGEGPRTPDGFEVVASIGPKRNPLPPSNDFITLESPSKKKQLSKCGHQGPKTYHLDVYGLRSIKFIGRKHGCPACLTAQFKKEFIRCAVCGLPIIPGESVALYSRHSPGLRLDIATSVDCAVIGCMRPDCYIGGCFAGYWTEEGFKPYDFETHINAFNDADIVK